MDFTLKKYKALCKSIKKSYTVEEFLRKKPSKGVVLRHDVDRKPRNSLKVAKIEAKYGLKATYYFRYPFDKKIMSEIRALGHEIGYHYEVLDKAKGDYKKAIKLFKKELGQFKDVKTIAMHGNPLAKWSNRDLWKKYDFKKFGIIGEAYLSFGDVAYFTDTGRRWNNKKFNKKDHFNKQMIKVRNTDDVIKKIDKYDVVYISTHPERWTDDMIEWGYNLVWQEVKNLGKMMLR